MNMKKFGAGNSRGFSSSLEQGTLPAHHHITYEGVFNELKFDVGTRTEKDVDLKCGFARYQFAESIFDPRINDFLPLFLKGQCDGKDRDERKLNSVICLDISGSMGCQLSQRQSSKEGRTRLTLSLEAIKMFISKLRPDDAVGIVIFQSTASTILPVTLKSAIPNNFYDQLNKIVSRGGTYIKFGFQQSIFEMKRWLSRNSSECCENRIIMLTDVEDNCIESQTKFIDDASRQSGINLTIIGISSSFQSHVCQSLKNIRGFNYFCAVNDEDIKKEVYESFDFNFFPSVYNLQISISSEDIQSFEVYGVPDSDQVANYNHNFEGPRDQYIITKVKSSFPSAIEIHGDTIFNEGGLILLKLKRRSKAANFKANIIVSYEALKGQRVVQSYPLSYQFHPDQQFFSEACLRQAIEGFYFVHQLKQILRESKSISSKDLYGRYWNCVMELKKFSPRSKLKDLQNIAQIILKCKQKQIQN